MFALRLRILEASLFLQPSVTYRLALRPRLYTLRSWVSRNVCAGVKMITWLPCKLERDVTVQRHKPWKTRASLSLGHTKFASLMIDSHVKVYFVLRFVKYYYSTLYKSFQKRISFSISSGRLSEVKFSRFGVRI